jgi:hypothetical protein
MIPISDSENAIIEKILGLLSDNDIDPIRGEELLLHIAGLSAGMRQAPITGDWLKPLATSWAFAAVDGDNQ